MSSTSKTCPRCHGTGEVTPDTGVSFYVTGVPQPIRCPKCHGHCVVPA